MPRLAKRKAIRECKRLWKEIKKSGLSKFGFLCSPNGRKWLNKDYEANCPLCEYAGDERGDCPRCPLRIQYGKDCLELGYRSLSTDPSFFNAIRGLKE